MLAFKKVLDEFCEDVVSNGGGGTEAAREIGSHRNRLESITPWRTSSSAGCTRNGAIIAQHLIKSGGRREGLKCGGVPSAVRAVGSIQCL